MSPRYNKRSQWREWAVMLTLEEDGRSMTATEVRYEIERASWDVFADLTVSTDLTRYTLNSLAKRGFVFRTFVTGDSVWSLTERGRQFVHDALLDNPNVTPVKSREEFANV